MLRTFYILAVLISEYSVTFVGSLRGLPNPVNGNPRQKFVSKLISDGKQVAAYAPSQSVPQQKKTGENLFGEIAVTVVSEYCVMLVGTLWGLPYPVNGNLRQEFAGKLTNDGI